MFCSSGRPDLDLSPSLVPLSGDLSTPIRRLRRRRRRLHPRSSDLETDLKLAEVGGHQLGQEA